MRKNKTGISPCAAAKAPGPEKLAVEAFESPSQRGEGLSPGGPVATVGRLLPALCALGHGVRVARARSCSGGCLESREAGIWDKTQFVSPAITSLISSSAACVHMPQWGGSPQEAALVIPQRLWTCCPHWSLIEDLTTTSLCSLWDWAPWERLPLAGAAGEESSAKTLGHQAHPARDWTRGHKERVSQCPSQTNTAVRPLPG